MKFKSLFIAAAAMALAWPAAAQSADAVKREMRSVWMAGMGIDWPKTSGTGEAVRQKQQMGLSHAVGCARSMVSNDYFAVMVGDDFMVGDDAGAPTHTTSPRSSPGAPTSRASAAWTPDGTPWLSPSRSATSAAWSCTHGSIPTALTPTA